MLNFAFKLIVKFLYGMSADQWKASIAIVKELATWKHEKPEGSEKVVPVTNSQRASKFFAYFKTHWPDAEDRAIEKTRDLARDFAKKKGWIDT
jgi:hypothetical protein